MDGKDSFIGRLMGSAEKLSSEQVAQTVQLLLEHGARWQASDIHIEPHESYVLVRYRIDGNLRGAHKIPRRALQPLSQHLRSLASLDSAPLPTPQQGTFRISIQDQSYDVHIATMPVYGGEKLVLHLATQNRPLLPLKQLGYWGKNLEVIQHTLGQGHGMIVVSAPKHHGRPTTQASMLAALHNPGLNIATIEEHIEYRIPHANQSAVNHRNGLTMLKGLQSALHQDPNVLLVGDIHAKPTAELSLEAAMSGHLIVGGMHNDSACSALLHLRAIGIPVYLIMTGIRLVTAQRLVRRLCEHCRERYQATNAQLQDFQEAFGITTPSAFKRVHELETQAIALGMGNDAQPSTTAKAITHLWRARPDGCEACNHTGYKGRVAIVEVLRTTDTVQKALNNSETTAASLQSQAIKTDGFIPLALDGVIKALRGRTGLADILQVARTA